MAEKTTEKDESNENNQIAKPTALEWIIAVIGVILVVGSIGFLLYSAIIQTDKPPTLIVNKKPTETVEGGFLVKFVLENKGENNAAAVTVEGKLMNGEKEIETSSASISYAPSNSKREGGLFFNENPDDPKFKLELRALGYEKP
jgi:uncharacterized protein (TIGR02588 family)